MIDMSPSLTLVILCAVLVAAGAYLLQERSLSRIVVGSGLVTHGLNLLLLVAGGRAGTAPIIGTTPNQNMSDPLPQAMVLTAIVIALALTAFMLAMSYRSWQLNGHDEVQDDLEDRAVARRAALDAINERVADDSGATIEQEATEVHDDTGMIPAVQRLAERITHDRDGHDRDGHER